MSTPPFSLTATREDMNSFLGRCKHFYRTIDPRHMFRTTAEIRGEAAKIDAFKTGRRDPRWTDAELWHAREVVESCVHPATKEVIFPVVRISALMPVNLYIVPYMLMPSTIASPLRTIWIHWFNQSYNAAVNYANRSSESVPVQILAQGYAAAVGVSVSGSLGATYLMKTMTDTTSVRATIVRATVPFLAVAFSGAANVSMMRQDEWSGRGVDVYDDEGNVYGKSTVAGKLGVTKCAAARFLWNIPIMVLPPLLMIPVGRLKWVQASRNRGIFAETMCCVVGMGIGVAPGLAVFKPVDKIAVAKLEPRFHNLKDGNGKPIEFLNFYKGL